MKSEGYTQNMPVDFKADQVTGFATLQAIINKFPKLAIVIKRDIDQVELTTTTAVKKAAPATIVLMTSVQR
ncbi:MAG: hypothetical protein HQ518_22660 [Rhodopirellula sp.]|nr:hypothetical protein [Rhodopirellula sp.]